MEVYLRNNCIFNLTAHTPLRLKLNMMNQTKMEDVLPLKKKQPLSNCYQWLKEENDMPATLMKYPPLENHIVMRPAWFEHLQCEKTFASDGTFCIRLQKL